MNREKTARTGKVSLSARAQLEEDRAKKNLFIARSKKPKSARSQLEADRFRQELFNEVLHHLVFGVWNVEGTGVAVEDLIRLAETEPVDVPSFDRERLDVMCQVVADLSHEDRETLAKVFKRMGSVLQGCIDLELCVDAALINAPPPAVASAAPIDHQHLEP